jgi:hypothetical protein
MPLHRSITFWSGLLVLAFILIAWRDSRIKVAYLHWEGRRFYFSLLNAESALWFDYHGFIPSRLPSTYSGGFAVGRERFPGDPFADPSIKTNPPCFPKPVHRFVHGPTRSIAFAHWFVLALQLLLWSALIYYRHRRINRNRTALPSPPPAQPQTD